MVLEYWNYELSINHPIYISLDWIDGARAAKGL
jgi:hypothetical protein